MSGAIRSREIGVRDLLRALPAAMAGSITSEFHQAASWFGDPAGAVALDAEQTLDGGGPESFGDLELDERHDRHLVLAKSIIRRWLRHADRFADDRQQLERDPGPIADLLERLGGKVGEPLKAGCIEEVERQTHHVGWR